MEPDHDILIRLDEKVDSLHSKVDKLTDDHEKRLRSLEKQKWIIMGGTSAVATLASWGLLKLFP